MNEDKKTYNGHTYSGNLLSACLNGYEQGKTDMFDEVIKTLAESEDTMLSDKQYYTLMELKEQK